MPLKKEKANDPSGKNVTVYFYDMVKDGNNVVLLDLKKNQNALLPNSMHHIDAEILFLTISKLLQKNIPILAIHDAYYTSFEHASEVKESYINSYRTIMKGKPLVAYIRNSFSY